MQRRSVFFFPFVLASLRASLRANPAQGDPRKEKLFSMFIAPCCWRQNLLVHQSPKAEELRTEILGLVAAGRTDDQIKQHFVGQYSLRILALPEGARRGWLFWTPVAAVASGLGAIVLFLSQSVRQARRTAPVSAAHLPDVPASEWE